MSPFFRYFACRVIQAVGPQQRVLPPQQASAEEAAAGKGGVDKEEASHEQLDGAKSRTGLTEIIEATRSASTGTAQGYQKLQNLSCQLEQHIIYPTSFSVVGLSQGLCLCLTLRLARCNGKWR